MGDGSRCLLGYLVLESADSRFQLFGLFSLGTQLVDLLLLLQPILDCLVQLTAEAGTLCTQLPNFVQAKLQITACLVKLSTNLLQRL